MDPFTNLSRTGNKRRREEFWEIIPRKREGKSWEKNNKKSDKKILSAKTKSHQHRTSFSFPNVETIFNAFSNQLLLEISIFTINIVEIFLK